MQKHVNVTIPLACPNCLSEILTTLDDVQDEPHFRCPTCHTDVELKAEDLVPPAIFFARPEPPYFGIEF
jgi:hypothetical protein